MGLLLVVLTAVAVSIAVIPLMMRLAPRLRMVDLPDPRKVHAAPVPRVGGIGIALGALTAILVAAPHAPWLAYYVAGALALLAFGALDDSRELGHYAKFAGQFLAVAPLVWLGDVWVSSLPLVTSPLPPEIGKPFTAFALVGVINAVNHSDGLDGLAGGETVLSLGCIAYLAYLAADLVLALMSLAVLGGVFGFLRFNTHPARVFMGDAGSQFLGFSLGVFVVVLTQQSSGGLSMALPLLILGLPVADILAVLYLRASGGSHWFRATRNHVHHRLLGLGLDHHQAVVLIYALQTLFVVSAIVWRHDSDLLVLALYLVPCALVFAGLTALERRGWRARREGGDSAVARLLGGARAQGVGRALLPAITVAVSAYFIGGGLAVRVLPPGVWPALAGIALALALAAAAPRLEWLRMLARFAVYSLAPLWVFGVERQLQAMAPGALASMVPFYGALAVSIALVWKLSPGRDFAPTTMDFLIAVAVVATAFLAGSFGESAQVAALLVKIVTLLYACELVYAQGGRRAREALTLAALVSALLALVGIA
jgi:UDP-GlcNAc:undecaprenyl-phosphate GlcNAc-1-phosphate transferase